MGKDDDNGAMFLAIMLCIACIIFMLLGMYSQRKAISLTNYYSNAICIEKGFDHSVVTKETIHCVKVSGSDTITTSFKDATGIEPKVFGLDLD